jgi:heme-degrading monooxygenase HmoA
LKEGNHLRESHIRHRCTSQDRRGNQGRAGFYPAGCKEAEGFMGLYFLGNRSTGKGMTIVMWNTEADMTAGESSGFYREQVAKVAPLLSGATTMEHYEVSVKG